MSKGLYFVNFDCIVESESEPKLSYEQTRFPKNSIGGAVNVRTVRWEKGFSAAMCGIGLGQENLDRMHTVEIYMDMQNYGNAGTRVYANINGKEIPVLGFGEAEAPADRTPKILQA